MLSSPNRWVAVATPLIFAPLAGAVTAWAAKHAPGVDIDQGKLQAIFIAGATIAVAKSSIWMKGWQDWEKRQEILPADVLDPANGFAAVATGELDLGEDARPEQTSVADAEPLSDDADLAYDEVDPIARLEAAFATPPAGA